MLCNTDESEEEELRYLEMLAGQNVDGVLLVPSKGAEKACALAERYRLPLVLLERRIPTITRSLVHCDTRKGAREMMRYLLTLGHREIALLATPIGAATVEERIEGAMEAIEGSDARCHVIRERLNKDTATKIVDEWARMDPRPTALFATNNLLTISTLKALRAKGFRVPDDVSLAGFDDLPAHLVEQPFLTVVSQPAYQIGKVGVELLLSEIADRSTERKEVTLEPQILVRGSCREIGD
jgi:LacI family transcriptional regulator